MRVRNHSVRLTSDHPVSVYALNQRIYLADATYILPVTALGTNYYHISYDMNDAYAVIAIQNNTQVYYNNTLVATLNRGDVYYYNYYNDFSYIPYDMTGDSIIADKPVALFAMNIGTPIPLRSSALDNLFEQMAPVPTWGKNFFVPVSSRLRDFVRIVAAQDGTTISQTGAVRIHTGKDGQTTLNNLNAGQWVELEVSLDSNGCYIQADKPVGICTYLAGCMYNETITGNVISDPAQAWLPAVEQRIKSALITPFIPRGATALTAHYALVITPTTTKDSTTVKISNATEQPLSGGTWHNHASGYSFYDMPLANDSSTYLFTNAVGGLIVMGYGMGVFESYYYLAASAMRNLGALFYVNEIHYQEFAFKTICESTLQFHAQVEGEMSTNTGHLKWYINNVEEVAARDMLTWTKTLDTGVYQIKMIILYEDDITTQTLETTFTIVNVKVDVRTTPEFCNKVDGTITLTVENGERSLNYIWKGRTDTINTLTGLKAGTYKVTISDTFCIKEETIIVEHIVGPVAEFEPNPQTANLGEEIQFMDKSIQGEGEITSLYWNFGDEEESSSQNPAHTYTTSGSFMVLLKIEDENACKDSIEHEVLIMEELDFPNLFSPVGSDGKKYVFRPLKDGGYFKDFTIEIYDRWGMSVWSKQCKAPNCPDYDDSFWWDGTNEMNRQVANGIYYWVVYACYYSSDVKPFIKNGSVTVISK
jgi:PKD repeat protein